LSDVVGDELVVLEEGVGNVGGTRQDGCIGLDESVSRYESKTTRVLTILTPLREGCAADASFQLLGPVEP
jgi:hypothetical protein